jgi:hypothetical protein
MAVDANIHETVIARIEEGLRSEIRIDAFPDKLLKGYVKKVALLPDSQNRWYNPELKVYKTSVAIDQENAGLKPGMSARVRIVVQELEDILMVPIHAVANSHRKNYAFVKEGDLLVKREVETGDYNDDFIEIKNGLNESEMVALNAAALMDEVSPDSGSGTQRTKRSEEGKENRSEEKEPAGQSEEKEPAGQSEEKKESETETSPEQAPAPNQARLDSERRTKRVDS